MLDKSGLYWTPGSLKWKAPTRQVEFMHSTRVVEERKGLNPPRDTKDPCRATLDTSLN